MNDDGKFSLEAVQLLLENGGDLQVRDNTGRSVILFAACGNNINPYLNLLDALLEKNDITREEKIDALEVAGAVLLGNEGKSEEDVALAFRYWRRALTLRLLVRPIYKTPMQSTNGSLKEWSTLEDLLLLEHQDPSQHEIQALLIRLRIFSRLCWRAVRKHVFPSILNFLMNHSQDRYSISQKLEVSWIAIDTILRTKRPYEGDLGYALEVIVGMFIIPLMNLPKFQPSLNSEMLKKVMEFVLMTDPSYLTQPIKLNAPLVKTCHLFNVCGMVNILSNHPEMMTEDIRLTLVRIVCRDSRDSSGRNLLAVACTNHDYFSDNLPIVRLLVQCGANLDARFSTVGCGILHLLAVMNNEEKRDATGRLILELGAHLDLADNEGKTAADLWLEKNEPKKKEDLPDWLQEGVPKLQCLSARVIRRHGVPYKENNVLPADLIPFVSLHSCIEILCNT